MPPPSRAAPGAPPPEAGGGPQEEKGGTDPPPDARAVPAGADGGGAGIAGRRRVVEGGDEAGGVGRSGGDPQTPCGHHRVARPVLHAVPPADADFGQRHLAFPYRHQGETLLAAAMDGLGVGRGPDGGLVGVDLDPLRGRQLDSRELIPAKARGLDGEGARERLAGPQRRGFFGPAFDELQGPGR